MDCGITTEGVLTGMFFVVTIIGFVTMLALGTRWFLRVVKGGQP